MNRRHSSLEWIRLYLILLCMSLSFVLNAQGERQDSMAQYLFPAFSKCSIMTKSGAVYNLMLNYNIVSEKLVFIRNEKYFNLANPETVDTVFIEKSRFVPRETYFIEVISGGKVSVFKRNKAELKALPRPGAYGTATDLTSSNLQDGVNTPQGYYYLKVQKGYTVRQASSYLVRLDGNWTRFTTENQFLRAFGEKGQEIKAYIKANGLHINNKDDVEKIGIYCNSIVK